MIVLSADMIFDPSFPDVPSKLMSGVDYVGLQRWKWHADHNLHFATSRLFTNKFNTYYNTTTPSNVQNAINTAVNLYSSYYNFNVFVNVEVTWTDLTSISPTLLGQGKPSIMCQHPNVTSFNRVLIPATLYIQMTNASNCPGASNNIHITLNINSNPPAPWYLGVDGNPPSNQIDIMTVVMHELTHGMGFVSGSADALCNYPSSPNKYIYDVYALNALVGWPATTNGAVSSPCTSSPSVLSGGTLYFQGTVGGASNNRFPIYLPSTYSSGSSISHVDTNGMSVNLLMGYSIGTGKAFHDIGGFVWSVMSTFGYNMKNCSLLTSCNSCISDFCEWCYQDAFCGDSEAPGFWGAPATCSVSNGWLNNTAWCGNGGSTLSSSTAAAATTTLGCIPKINVVTGATTCGASSLGSSLLFSFFY